jgi:hypothetical protein
MHGSSMLMITAVTLTKFLQWLYYSARLAEIAEVLAINLDGEPGFAHEQRLPIAQDVITVC